MVGGPGAFIGDVRKAIRRMDCRLKGFIQSDAAKPSSGKT